MGRQLDGTPMIDVDLRSDTLTKPTPEMRDAIAAAVVGDAAYGEDPTVQELEEYCAALFGKPAALFTATGTMSNQIAVRALTSPGDEIVLDYFHHINYFESRQTALHAGVVFHPCFPHNGVLSSHDVAQAIHGKLRDTGYCRPTLVCLENTISFYGGKVFPLTVLKDTADFAHGKGISVYVDGARLLNACVRSGLDPRCYAAPTDAVSLCFAKGLGAPFGSILAGSSEFVGRARLVRKWLGGNMHQAGIMAAAALFALRNNIGQLDVDHEHARLLYRRLSDPAMPAMSIIPPDTNIVMFDVSALGVTAAAFVAEAARHGVGLLDWTHGLVRAVAHHPITAEQIEAAASAIRTIYDQCMRWQPACTPHPLDQRTLSWQERALH